MFQNWQPIAILHGKQIKSKAEDVVGIYISCINKAGENFATSS